MRLGLAYNVRETGRSDDLAPKLAAEVGVADRPVSSNRELPLAAGASATGASAAMAGATMAGGNIGLAGDEQEEFDSPETVAAIADSLRSLGHEVAMLGEGEELMRRLLAGPRPELVVNIAEGRGQSRCREARAPAILEALGVPFTGSDPLTLAVTLDKPCAKKLVASAGVATAPWALYVGKAARCDCLPEDESLFERQLAQMPLPAFVKPAYEGSSKGVLDKSICEDIAAVRRAVETLFAAYRQPVLVEEFIVGDELTVGVVGNRPPRVIGIMRVLPTGGDGPFVYSLECKREWETRVIYECPAQISPDDAATVERATLACWRALGCRDVSRFDFRLRDGVPYFLEVNPLPGLSPHSGDLVILSRQAGLTHQDLLGRIVGAACQRYGLAGGGG